MKKWISKGLAVGMCALLLTSFVDTAQAQRGRGGPGGGRGRDGGRGGEGRGGQDGRPRPERPNPAKRRLNGIWMGMWRLEGSSTPLSKAQAKRIVELVRPWSNKSSMSQNQAQSLYSSLNAVLTTAQRSVTADDFQDGPPRDGRGDGRGGPPNGGFQGGPPRDDRGGPPNGPPPDGPPRDGRGDGNGPPREAMRAFMETFNPFYAPTGYSQFKTFPEGMRRSLVRRYQEARATLIVLSRKAS